MSENIRFDIEEIVDAIWNAGYEGRSIDGEKLIIDYMVQEKTLGEKRVRTSFNPSNNSKVDVLKKKFAELINDVNELEGAAISDADRGELARLKALAITNLETAAMWAIKAATA